MDGLWTPPLIVWSLQGLDHPGLALLRVKIRTGEDWDAPSSSTMAEIMAAVHEELDPPAPVDTGDHKKIRIKK